MTTLHTSSTPFPMTSGGLWPTSYITPDDEPPPEPGATTVRWVTSGHLDDAVRVRFAVASTCTVGLRYSTQANLSTPMNVSGTLGADLVADVETGALTPGTTYYAKALTGGVVSGPLMSWRVPTASHRVAFGSCSTSTTVPVWDTIAATTPDFLLHAGDWGYDDPVVGNDLADFRAWHETRVAKMSPMLRSVPIEYIVDGHDSADAWSEQAVVPVANDAFRAHIPHRDLATADGMERAFTIGRVRYIIIDTQSHRSDPGGSPSSARTKLGATQKAWLKQELLDAQSVHECLLTVWVSTHPFQVSGGVERWGSYATERAEMATFITTNGLADRLQCWSGDRHWLSLDDGTNNPYGGFPQLISAPLAFGSNSADAMTATVGPFRSGSYFTVIDIDDNGVSGLDVNWSGRAADTGTEVGALGFTYPDL